MRAISAFIFEYGTNSSGFCAFAALRTRASKSAIGSVTVLISGGLRGGLLRTVAKRHAHFRQKRLRLGVRPRSGDDCNIETNVALDFIQLDFRENCLIGDTERVVALAVESAR